MARGVDISDSGIGIRCDAILAPDQTLMFQAELAHRTGAVILSSKAEYGQCQGGIQFT